MRQYGRLKNELQDIRSKNLLHRSNDDINESVNKALDMICNDEIYKKNTFHYSKSGSQSGHDKNSITPRAYLNLQLNRYIQTVSLPRQISSYRAILFHKIIYHYYTYLTYFQQ